MVTMVSIKLLLCLVVLVHHRWSAVQSKSVEGPPVEGVRPDILAVNQEGDGKSSSGLVGALSRKARNAGCLRCYEDRYSGGYGRSGDDRNNWYPQSYDRYNERMRPDYDRNSYRDRDDRYMPRTYDRYDNRGYDNRGYDLRGYDSRGYDRYDTRRDYGESRGYGYQSKGQYYDRYGGDQGDRYRPSSPKYGGGREDYDRYYPRYDYRNYRPWDETYSSPYGGRPVRPIKGSYLFDRDSNSVTAGDSGNASANDGRAQKNDKKDGSSSPDRNTNSGSNSNAART